MVMRTGRASVAAAVLVSVAWSGPHLSAQQVDASRRFLTAVDYFEIEALYARSNVAMDRGVDGGRAFANTFVSNGVLTRDGLSVSGRKQLAELTKTEPTQRTWIANLLIEPSAEGAVGWAYVIQIPLPPAGAASPAGVAATEGGLYHDTIVRTPEGWRSKSRTYRAGHGFPSRKP